MQNGAFYAKAPFLFAKINKNVVFAAAPQGINISKRCFF
jgi:hypothetical protein